MLAPTTNPLEKPDITIPITDILDHQRATRLAWRSSTYRERQARLNQLEDWIQNNKHAIRIALYQDFQKPELETDMSEVFPVLSEIRHTRRQLKRWMKPRKVGKPITLLGTKNWVQQEPKGSSLIIAPWNYPFNLQVVPLISCLAAGCPAVLKPSELTPHTANLIQRMAEELFRPEEVVVYQGGKEVSQALLAQPFDHIFFTGSPQVGQIVMEAAAKNLTSVTLELGGKSPAIVSRGVNLKQTADRLAVGKWLNAGQTCIAPDYLLVEESIVDEFLEVLSQSIREMYGVDAEQQEASRDYTRVVNHRHFKRLQSWLHEALEAGAQLVCGGYTNEQQNFISPTVVKGLTEDTSLMEEEIFGPILPVKTYRQLSEAIDYINEKPKPLALYLFTTSKAETQIVLNQTSSGAVGINDTTLHFLNPNLPFGGVNHSGIGKGHGIWGFRAFSNPKAVLKQRQGFTSTSLFKPPYSPLARQLSRFVLKYL